MFKKLPIVVILLVAALVFWIVANNTVLLAAVSPSKNMVEYSVRLVSGSERAQELQTAEKNVAVMLLHEAKVNMQETMNTRANFHDQENVTPILASLTDSGVEQAAETTIKKKVTSAAPVWNDLVSVYSYC